MDVDRESQMTADDLRAWQTRMGYTNTAAAESLGMSLSGYVQLRSGFSRTSGKPLAIDKRTCLACLAIEAGLRIKSA